jgi:hypothetical protein
MPPIQLYDIISSPLVTVMFYQFYDLMGEHQTLRFLSCYNFSTLIKSLDTFVLYVIEDNTY